jgi:hypothetical protein
LHCALLRFTPLELDIRIRLISIEAAVYANRLSRAMLAIPAFRRRQ